MREILFRGKSANDGKWVVGDGIHYPKSVNYKGTCWIDGMHEKANDWVRVIPSTVGQFTGLTDNKNGRRIFEGDIGRYKQTDGAKRNGDPILCTGKVVYNTKTASYAVESRDEAGCKYFDYFPIKDFKVIGNIHDNPELLGGDRNETQ